MDRLERRLAVLALGDGGEVHHHDAVLLHQADEHDDADERVQAQLALEDQQRQQRAEAGRRQARQDDQRLREALVEDAEHEVDHDDGHQQDQAEAAQRILERLRRALEARRHRGRQRRGRGRLDLRHGIAEREAGLEVERDRHRRQLAGVADAQRARRRWSRCATRVQRHQLAASTSGRTASTAPPDRAGTPAPRP